MERGWHVAWIPARVCSRPAFMITKESRSIAIKILRQEQSLRDHGDTVEVACGSNPKFPDLIPRPLGAVAAVQIVHSPRGSRDTGHFGPAHDEVELKAAEALGIPATIYPKIRDSGSGRRGASDREEPTAAREIQRRENQEEGCPPIDAVREAHDARGDLDTAADDTRAPREAEVAVLPWVDEALHAGSRGR